MRVEDAICTVVLRSLAMRTLIVALRTCLRAALKSRAALAFENAALRQQHCAQRAGTTDHMPATDTRE